MDEFMWRALSAGIGVALIAGAMGSFLVWRRMAFFGDTLSHSALLGIAFGLLLDVDLTLAALLLCVLVAAGYARLQGSRRLASDTMLAVIAHGSLAVGIIAVSLLAPRRASLESYLFGFKEVDKQKTYSITKDGQVVVFLEILEEVRGQEAKVFWTTLRHGLNAVFMAKRAHARQIVDRHLGRGRP